MVRLRLAVGDDLGFVRVVEAAGLAQLAAAAADGGGAPQAARWGQTPPSRARGVTCLACGPGALAAGRTDGSVDVLCPDTGRELGSLDADDAAAAGGGGGGSPAAVRGLWWLRDGRRLAACDARGRVAVYAGEEEVAEEEGDGAGGPAGRRWSFAAAAAFETRAPAEAVALNEAGTRFAVGGRGSLLTLWDVAAQRATFTAKPPKPGRLGLTETPWPTCAAFFPPQGDAVLAAGTADYKLRVYDTRASRRPTVDVTVGEARLMAVLPDPAQEGHVWAADGRGVVECWDLRAGHRVGGVHGANGSVRALARHPTLPLLAAGGLDRWVHVHSTTAGRVKLSSTYVKQYVNAVCFLPPGAGGGPEASEEEEEGEREVARGDDLGFQSDGSESSSDAEDGAADPRPRGRAKKQRLTESQALAKRSRRHR